MTDDFWQKNYGITPLPVIDLDVWRGPTGHQSLPEEPELAACQRADAAYELGDMFNFELWQRVAKAVRELIRTKPRDGKAVN